MRHRSRLARSTQFDVQRDVFAVTSQAIDESVGILRFFWRRVCVLPQQLRDSQYYYYYYCYCYYYYYYYYYYYCYCYKETAAILAEQAKLDKHRRIGRL